MSYIHDAVIQYVIAHGADDPARAWILSPFDTWHENPFYVGPAVRHPEDWSPEDDDYHADATDAEYTGQPVDANAVDIVDLFDDIPF